MSRIFFWPETFAPRNDSNCSRVFSLDPYFLGLVDRCLSFSASVAFLNIAALKFCLLVPFTFLCIIFYINQKDIPVFEHMGVETFWAKERLHAFFLIFHPRLRVMKKNENELTSEWTMFDFESPRYFSFHSIPFYWDAMIADRCSVSSLKSTLGILSSV